MKQNKNSAMVYFSKKTNKKRVMLQACYIFMLEYLNGSRQE
ncbi:hypothetical protein PALI_b0222 [Pseudoalteromonas aliena SW19]|uniref:Transposase n=1 Tax=Pseudoalteromonas aliena SW19 TaxID=1314866 RepID=A0ABR9E3T9_9GAMM|nr:hypothetical protein [Pseudoalteromonas aliena SW19]